MATPKIQNAYRNPSSDTEDIADLLLVTTSGLATDGDAGASYIVFHNGSNDVLVSSSNALPVSVSGVATAANQSTANGLLTTIDADTGTIATHAATLAGAVSGTEVQVDIVSGTVTVTGVSTLAEQQSQTTLLGTIDTDTGNIATNTTDLPNVIGTDGSAGPSKAVSVAGTESGGTLQEIRVDADGHLQVDVLSTTGTTTVSGTVDLGATDNAVLDAIAASVASTDGKITACNTGAVVVSSSALPSGAATAAKQPALGTAGTASADVITVQGIASMTALKVDGSAVTQPVSGTFWQATQPVSIASAVPITDNSESVTVDAPVGTPVFVRLSDGVSEVAPALETGGNLAAAATSLGVLDDWDESDRAKVNTIAGQAGVQGGAGTITANTQRVTIGTDDLICSPIKTGQRAPAQMMLIGGYNGSNYYEANVSSGGALTVAVSGSISTVSTVTNLSQMGGSAIAMGTGVRSAGTQRVTIATDDVVPASQSGTWTVDLGATDNAVLDTIASPVATIGTTPLQRVAIFDASNSQITSFGGGTEYTEDAVAAADPVGKATILVREDAPVSVAADGDNVAQRGTAYGAAYVQVVDSSGNFVDTFGGSGGTSSADDADFTAGTTLGTIVQGVYESSPTSVTDGDVGAVGITATRQLKTSAAQSGTWTVDLGATDNAVLDDIAAKLGTIDADTSVLAAVDFATGADVAALGVTGGGVEASALRVTIASDSTGVLSIDDNGGAITVDNGGTFAVQATVAAGATTIAKAEDAASANADVGVPAMAVRKATPVNTSGTDGDYEMLQMSAGRLWCSATIDAALPAGTNGIGKLTANSGVTIGAVELAAAQTLSTVTTVSTVTTCSTVTTLANGQTSHDSAVTGSPLRIGAKAETALSGITLVADGDATDLHAGVDGVLITRNHTGLEDIVVGNASNTDGTSTEVIAAAGAGIKQYLTSVTLSNMSATGIYVEMKSGTTVRWRFPVPANGGVTHRFDPPLPPNAANEAWNFDPSAAATTIYCSALGFKSKV